MLLKINLYTQGAEEFSAQTKITFFFLFNYYLFTFFDDSYI